MSTLSKIFNKEEMVYVHRGMQTEETHYSGKYKGYDVYIHDWTCTPHGGWLLRMDEAEMELSTKEEVLFILNNLKRRK